MPGEPLLNVPHCSTLAGGRQKLEELLDKAHEAGLKVMLDIAPNHMGYAQSDEEFAELNPFNSTK